MVENSGRDDFVDENPAVLRVILKLDNVEVAVIGFDEMRLRSTPHLADEANGVYGHKPARSRSDKEKLN